MTVHVKPDPIVDDVDVHVSPERAELIELIAQRQLAILAIRANELAERVLYSDVEKIDAVDMIYTAAVASGAVDLVGDDAVQEILAWTFAKVHA